MSRVGKKPIPIPKDTTVSYKDRVITVKGKKGTLERVIHPDTDLKIEDQKIYVIPTKETRQADALHGTMRNLVANMVTGVSSGFERILEVNGIGYRVEVKDNTLTLNLGYSHPIHFPVPKSVTASVDKNAIKLAGIDKEELGHVAAAIRRLRGPEPYKGKGIKFAEERIQRKAGKTGTK